MVRVVLSHPRPWDTLAQAHLAQATLSSVFHVPCTLSMASIDPTPEEMQQWTDISSVLSWAGLAGDPTEAASPAGSFLRHLGFTSTAPVRVLGMISATDLTEFLRIGRLMVKTPLWRNAPRRHLWGVALVLRQVHSERSLIRGLRLLWRWQLRQPPHQQQRQQPRVEFQCYRAKTRIT